MGENVGFSRFIVALFIVASIPGCASSPFVDQLEERETSKIKFRIDDIRPDGLRGPSEGLRSIAYEFCVPAVEHIYQEVKRIDPSLEIYPASPGRIGCGQEQTLCIGQTHQPNWRDVLNDLATLSYIAEIRENFFE